MKTIKITSWSQVTKYFTGIIEHSNGNKYWYKEGEAHREDGPAVERSNGDKEWYIENHGYGPINLKNYVVLDYYKGKHEIMWYKFVAQNGIFEYPDIPGLIEK